MIQFTKICPHCGEEYWGKHECEGTRREAAEAAAEALRRKRVAELEEAQRIAESLNWIEEMVCNADIPWVETQPRIEKSINDPVHHPKHYTSHPSGVECIDVTKHYNFQIGNAMKYLWRQGLKDEKGLDPVEKQIQDCEKAIWYIQSYIKDLKGN